jgi:hypothetical protein
VDVALLNLLEDRSPTASPSPAGATQRLRDLWLAGVPLERAADAAGLTVAEAERRLTGLGYRLTPQREAFDVEVLRRLYVNERLPAAQVGARLGLTEEQVRGRLRRAGIHRPPRVSAEQVQELYEGGPVGRGGGGRAGDPSARRVAPPRRRRCGPPSPRFPRGGAVEAGARTALPAGRPVVGRGGPQLRRRPAPLDRDTLERLYVDERLGIRAVAARLGVTETKVRAGLAHHGIAVRRPGRPSRP